MDDLVCVIVGDWVCGEGGVWEFVMPQGKYAKIISIAEVVGFADLLKVIRTVFKIPECERFRLSFWYPDVINICTSSRMPPVDISNDEGFRHFKKEFGLLNCLNIFLSFDVEDIGSSQVNENPTKVVSFEEVYVDEELIKFTERAEQAYIKNGPDKMTDFLAMEESENQCRSAGLSLDLSVETEPDPLFDQLVNLVDEDGEDVRIGDCSSILCTETTEIYDTTGHPRLSPIDSQPTQATFSLQIPELEICNTSTTDKSLPKSPNIREISYYEKMPVCDENDPFFVDPPP